MKAAVWTDYGVIEIKEVPEPQIGEHEVLLKVRKAGLCITDLHVYMGWFRYGEPPHILGHEMVGEIVKTGAAVKGWDIGQRVVVETSIGCGACSYCQNGDRHLCSQMSEIGFTPNQGAYAQYMKAPARNLVTVPKEVSDEEAAILESVVCPAGALYRWGVRFGETVAVFGVGAAGLAFIQTAKAMGAGKIIAIARNKKRLERSREFGADILIDSSTENVYEKLISCTGGQGADLVCEATGAPRIIEEAFHMVRKGGRVILYGIPSDKEKVLMPVTDIIMNQIEVYGAVGNPKVWKPLLALAAQRRIRLDKMITHRYSLGEINKAFELLKSKEEDPVKIVIDPWE